MISAFQADPYYIADSARLFSALNKRRFARKQVSFDMLISPI